MIFKNNNNYNFIIFSKISSQIIKFTNQVKKANYNGMLHIILNIVLFILQFHYNSQTFDFVILLP